MLLIAAHKSAIELIYARRIKNCQYLNKNFYKNDRNFTEWKCFYGFCIKKCSFIQFGYCVKSSQLNREGIGSNLGPRNFTIKKALQAPSHEHHSRYGDSEGTS